MSAEDIEAARRRERDAQITAALQRAVGKVQARFNGARTTSTIAGTDSVKPSPPTPNANDAWAKTIAKVCARFERRV